MIYSLVFLLFLLFSLVNGQFFNNPLNGFGAQPVPQPLTAIQPNSASPLLAQIQARNLQANTQATQLQLSNLQANQRFTACLNEKRNRRNPAACNFLKPLDFNSNIASQVNNGGFQALQNRFGSAVDRANCIVLEACVFQSDVFTFSQNSILYNPGTAVRPVGTSCPGQANFGLRGGFTIRGQNGNLWQYDVGSRQIISMNGAFSPFLFPGVGSFDAPGTPVGAVTMTGQNTIRIANNQLNSGKMFSVQICPTNVGGLNNNIFGVSRTAINPLGISSNLLNPIGLFNRAEAQESEIELNSAEDESLGENNFEESSNPSNPPAPEIPSEMPVTEQPAQPTEEFTTADEESEFNLDSAISSQPRQRFHQRKSHKKASPAIVRVEVQVKI